MTSQVETLRTALGGTASATVFHGEQEDRDVFRTFIRDARFATEWTSGVGDLTEVELARGKILARELLGPGRASFSAQGKLQVPNGASGNINMRLYVLNHADDTTRDPKAVLGLFTLVAIHSIPIAAPGAPAGQGVLQWDFDMLPLGVGPYGGSQNWRAKATYQRGGADAVQEHTAVGQLNADPHNDQTWLFTMQKAIVGGTFINTLLDVYSQDGIVRNGEDGQA